VDQDRRPDHRPHLPVLLTHLRTGTLGAFELFREYAPDGTLTLERETLHVFDDRHRLALVETRTAGTDDGPPELIRYQLANHLDSSVLELDQSAQVISYEEYFPYGSPAYQAVRAGIEAPKRYRYTGKERDTETGLYYHGARYYIPWVGRWASCDPAGLVDGPNLYAYARGNPISYRDPTGRCGKKPRARNEEAEEVALLPMGEEAPPPAAVARAPQRSFLGLLTSCFGFCTVDRDAAQEQEEPRAGNPAPGPAPQSHMVMEGNTAVVQIGDRVHGGMVTSCALVLAYGKDQSVGVYHWPSTVTSSARYRAKFTELYNTVAPVHHIFVVTNDFHGSREIRNNYIGAVPR
jgi:RHS repeat-associated protein